VAPLRHLLRLEHFLQHGVGDAEAVLRLINFASSSLNMS
jgi:hypothetical protein